MREKLFKTRKNEPGKKFANLRTENLQTVPIFSLPNSMRNNLFLTIKSRTKTFSDNYFIMQTNQIPILLELGNNRINTGNSDLIN